MATLVLSNGAQVWVRVPKCQVEDGLRICREERKQWSTTGLPEPEMVQVAPSLVTAVRP